LNDAPKEFRDHVEHLTGLINQIEDEGLRSRLFDDIETLVQGMNGPWRDCTVGWMIIGNVPDDLASLFDEDC
jgi:hypothetical protein